MTTFEKAAAKYTVGEDVYCNNVRGTLLEVGDESILIQWDISDEPIEYKLSDMPDITSVNTQTESILPCV